MAHSKRSRKKTRKVALRQTAPAVPEKPPPSHSTGRLRLESGLCLVAAGLTLWIVATTLAVIRSGYVPLPAWDEWDLWSSYLTQHYSLRGFLQQHNEHRLLVPGLLFALDHLAFHAREWFLLLCSFCLQSLSAFIVWRLFVRTSPHDRKEDAMAGATVVSCLFSAQQYVNFIWGFQVQFGLVYCCAIGSFLALLKSSERRQDGRGGRWISTSMALAAAATYSMANGILVWPLLVMLAWRLRTPRRQIAAIASGGALVGVLYFWGWHRVGTAPSPFASLAQFTRVVLFWLAHLGSPVSALSAPGHEFAVLVAARIAGGLLLVTVVFGYVLLWRPGRCNGAQAALLHICAFLVGGSGLMAIGRSYIAGEAFTSRYLTPSYLLWVCLLVWAWPWLRRTPRAALYAALTSGVFVGIAVHQETILQRVREWAAAFRLGETAVVAGVLDADAWRYVYHTPPLALDSVDYLRDRHLSLFTEEWTHWPGIQLNRRFSIDPRPGESCQGRIESVVPVPSLLRPGWHLSGWAWDLKARRPAGFVILGDDAGKVAGTALGGFPQPAESAGLSSQYSGSPWHGFISGEPRTITAYVLEADHRTLCAIGSRAARSFGSAARFTDLAAPLSGGEVQIDGKWTRDGYFQQVGAPPVGGLVFGSYAGADSNTGTLRLGPFHLDGTTAIAIPLVTGPDNAGLSLAIRDTVTKEILAELNPPPVRTEWWPWRPDLPAGRAISIEIIAEDRGTGFGQWQAVGWPHQIQK